jgi:hypothetical protein
MPKPNTPKLNDTQLVILSSASQRDETEAETVRTIYRLYQEIRSVDRVNMSGSFW